MQVLKREMENGFGYENKNKRNKFLTYFGYNSIKMQMEIRKTYKKMS